MVSARQAVASYPQRLQMHAFESDRTFALMLGRSLIWEVTTRYGPFEVGSVETIGRNACALKGKAFVEIITPVRLTCLMHLISAQAFNESAKMNSLR
jgi:hypothetical protein